MAARALGNNFTVSVLSPSAALDFLPELCMMGGRVCLRCQSWMRSFSRLLWGGVVAFLFEKSDVTLELLLRDFLNALTMI